MKNLIFLKTSLLLFLMPFNFSFSQVFEEDYNTNRTQESILTAAKYYEAAMTDQKWNITKTNVESPFKYDIVWENSKSANFKMKTIVHYDLQAKKAVLNLISTQYIYPKKEILISPAETDPKRKNAYEVSRKLFVDSFFDFLKF